uniref:Structural maintenance of chromosomes protein 5 n=1 Tax=Heterorhabditis bacteriophora TaxID=37862 RepID=A0A1I7XDF2_HETBA
MTLNTSLGCFDASTSHESLNRTTFGDNYPDGSIIKIIYTNFLTYDNAICIPGPNLNVIIGTNGAGKSTIICGICLAVGGSPKVLGRSERISDYIKHGCDQGSVELHITDQHNGTLRLKVMLKHPNNCEYYVNDVRKSQRQVRELVASYNIQIDNPCTFLAQDKVKSFSEQSPVELLKNTEKAFDEIQNKCVQEQERISRLLTDIDKLKDEVRYLNLKKAEKKQARKVTEKAHHEAEIKTVGSNIRMLNDQLRTQVNADYYKQKIVDAENKFCIMQNQSSNWEKDVMQLENEIGELEKRLDKAKDEAKEYEKMRVQNRIMENRIRTLEQLRCNYADEAWQWYEANKSQFEYPVYVPILHMTVKDNKSAVLLENLIGAREFPMFIFGSKKDEMILSDRKHRWKINSTVMTSKELHNVPIGTSKTNDIYDYIMKKLSSTTYRLYLTDTFRVCSYILSGVNLGFILLPWLYSGAISSLKVWRTGDSWASNLRSIQNSKPDIAEAKAALEEVKLTAVKDTERLVAQLTKKIENMRLLYVKEILLITVERNLGRAIQNAQLDILDTKEKFRELKTVLEEHQQRFQDLNKNKELIKAKLENVCKISSTASDQMDSQEQLIFQELQQLFEKEEIPETIDRLDKQMAEEKMKLDIASTDGNMQDLLRFEELTKEMKELIERKKTQVKMKQDWQVNMLKEIEEWRHPVEELVRNINVNYSAFFSELDCAGEVHLDVPDNALDIDAYGIMIMVSFRSNEKLRRLDHQVKGSLYL